MKSYLKIIINIIITSISLSILIGTLLKIAGPPTQNKNIFSGRRIRKNDKKEFVNGNSNFLYKNKLRQFKRLDKLTNRWELLINKNPDLSASAFFLSLDQEIYAEINSEVAMPAASSIKVPILIVLLSMIDSGEISWNENLILSKYTTGGGAGWMAYQKIGTKFPVYEIASEMIRVSDNTATNLLIERIGGMNIINKKFKEIGLKHTKVFNLLPDLDGKNITSAKDLSLAMAQVDSGFLLTVRSRDTFRNIMQKSKTNTLIPSGLSRGLGQESEGSDYSLSLKGYLVHNKTGDIGIAYSDTALIHTPLNSRAFATFIVKGPFNDPRSTELIRNLSAELVPFLKLDQNSSNPN